MTRYSHSHRLPITEWWDPAWDVYDVPGSPDVDDPDAPGHDVWWAAYEHLWMLRHIMTGRAEYTPHHFQHQLTTGAELCKCGCDGANCGQPGCRWHFPTGRCRCVWDVTHATQHHRIPNRSCPAHWQPPEPAPPAVPPCSCEYLLHEARMVAQSTRARVRAITAVVGSAFILDPWCPHHGAEPRWTPADRPWETTLGPDETS